MTDAWSDVIGQPGAVAQLQAAAAQPVHAYLLVGPPGSGKRAAARAFAAALLCPNGGCGECDVCRRVAAGVHPDLVVVERTGPAIAVDEARRIAQLAARSPVEGERKVLVVTDFHLVDKAAPALLKTVEEPPASAVFVILADYVPPELVTIASRSVVVEFGPVPTEAVVTALVAEGLDTDAATSVAGAAHGNMVRARLLASDDGFAERQKLWAGVPERLDGRGATAAVIAGELLASIDGVLEPLRQGQAAELAQMEEQAKLRGDRSRRKETDDRHRRELRRARMDELRAGLAVLSRRYRDRLVTGTDPTPSRALDALRATREALQYNPNETLLLQALLVRLSEDQRPY